MSFMANSLKNGFSVNDKSVLGAIEKHIKFMQLNRTNIYLQDKPNDI